MSVKYQLNNLKEIIRSTKFLFLNNKTEWIIKQYWLKLLNLKVKFAYIWSYVSLFHK